MAAAPVRPPVWPPAPSNIQPGRNDARMAAQKAFFEAAMAGAPKPQPAATLSSEPAPPKATAAQAVRSVAATAASAADRLPPPGSILNILV